VNSFFFLVYYLSLYISFPLFSFLLSLLYTSIYSLSSGSTHVLSFHCCSYYPSDKLISNKTPLFELSRACAVVACNFKHIFLTTTSERSIKSLRLPLNQKFPSKLQFFCITFTIFISSSKYTLILNTYPLKASRIVNRIRHFELNIQTIRSKRRNNI